MTPFDLAQRFVGEVIEIPGPEHAPFIQWCLEACGYGPEAPDETPWCSAFVNRIAWLLRLPRSKSAAARSWLTVGYSVPLEQATTGWDIVVLTRGKEPQPGPDVTDAPGHVGFFAGRQGVSVLVLGGNQANSVTVAPFSVTRVLAVRRLAWARGLRTG